MIQSNRGYGWFCFRQKTVRAHRASWELHNGPIPNGLHVLHKCDVRCCVNPDHLFLGTHLDNMRDRHLKGRSTGPKGSAAAKAKLSDADVVLIRSSKLPARELAESLGVNKSTIYSILNGRTWVHV